MKKKIFFLIFQFNQFVDEQLPSTVVRVKLDKKASSISGT